MRDVIAGNIQELGRWVCSVDATSIPPEILARAARVLADDMSAIVGARGEPEVRRFHEKTLGRAGAEESTVFNGGRNRTERRNAAVANGMAADWLELDEGYRVTPCHAGLYVVPALLAEAEASNLAFEDMLRALVLGYEFVTRVARSWTPRALNMQSHGRYCAIGAAAAVALARGADARRFIDAVGTAATLTGPSPRSHLIDGTLARNIWPATGAWNGFMAVEWAECGIAGAPTAFFDVYGTVLGGKPNPEHLVDGLGKRWAIEDGYTKIYACCQHLHSAVEATLGLRNDLLRDARLEDIEFMSVDTHGLALPLMATKPTTTLGAKFSMPHAIASTLVTGTGGAAAFSAATLDDPLLAGLRERVRAAPYSPELPAPNDRPARVTVTLKSGRSLQGECLSAQGGPDRPLPPATVFAKLDELASPVYPRMRTGFERLAKLERRKEGWRTILENLTAPETA